jgi:hypothetical protein
MWNIFFLSCIVSSRSSDPTGSTDWNFYKISLSPHEQSNNETDPFFQDGGRCYFNITTNRSILWYGVSLHLDDFSVFTMNESDNHQLEYHFSGHIRYLQGNLRVHIHFYSHTEKRVLFEDSLVKKSLTLKYNFYFRSTILQRAATSSKFFYAII